MNKHSFQFQARDVHRGPLVGGSRRPSVQPDSAVDTSSSLALPALPPKEGTLHFFSTFIYLFIFFFSISFVISSCFLRPLFLSFEIVFFFATASFVYLSSENFHFIFQNIQLNYFLFYWLRIHSSVSLSNQDKLICFCFQARAAVVYRLMLLSSGTILFLHEQRHPDANLRDHNNNRDNSTHIHTCSPIGHNSQFSCRE